MSAAVISNPVVVETGVPLALAFYGFEDAAGADVPLAGKAATMHVRAGSPDCADGAVALTVSTLSGGRLAFNAGENGYDFALSAADTAGLTPDTDYWAELIVYADGTTTTALYRPVVVAFRTRATGVDPT